MPHIQELTIKNYRVLRNVTFKDLQPFNVLLGPNGCGKSTVFDVLGFLGECLTVGVRKALETRGRLAELRSRGSQESVVIELKYRESDFGAPQWQRTPLITYHLEIGEVYGRASIRREFLKWRRGRYGKPFKFLDLTDGTGYVVTGEQPEDRDERRAVTLEDVTVPAIATLGQLAENPRVASLRRFIESWHLSYFIPDRARGIPEAGAHEHLSRTGENLANVVQYLHEQHPDVLDRILSRMSERIPGLETIRAERTIDGRLVLRFKDGPFEDPFLSRFVSDGTLKMFAYLVLLMDPDPPALLCIEEPENGLHPKLLHVLAEELRAHAKGAFSTKGSQVLVSSHAPYFVDALRPEELWIMQRGEDGFATVERADRIKGVPEFVQEGAVLGRLWMEDLLRGGNP